ncbi:killer cell lectin-like receptor subfamily B member 1B allele A [Vipera latastei]
MKQEDAFYSNYRPKRMQRRLKQSQMQDFLLEHPRCHSFLLGSGCAIILILVAALTALGIWALQLQRTPDVQDKIPATETASNVSAGDKWNMLQRFLCKTHCDNSTGNLELCPKDWQLHENKCYWISRKKHIWTDSRADCRAKDSELAVLKEQAELNFIQRFSNGAQLLWIGLSADSSSHKWLWVDNSQFNNTGLPIVAETQGSSCAMLKGTKIISESCSAVTKWICETEALVL